jgi:Ni/Fe-hydrogenase subunit HybB-like protein
MPDPLIILLKTVVAVVLAGLAVGACWLLAGRCVPRHVTPGLVWWVWLPILWALGGLTVVTRFTGGLGAMTNLSDTFPWGIWIGFDVLSGVALSAGGFLTAGAVYIFGLKKFYPILRPAILTAYLGYLLVVGGLLVDLGRPYNIWHPMIYWQHRSVMFEVGWCVTLYNLVLTVEFLPLLLEKFRWHRALRIVHSITIPIVIAGVILSTLHQSSLGALFLIVPEKLWPITYSPLLPLYFFISAVAVGLAMLIVESTLSAKAFNRSLETPIITALARAIPVVILVLLAVRVVDMTARSAWVYLAPRPFQTFTFLLHMTLLLVPTFVLLNPRWVHRPRIVFWCAVSVVAAVILNRLNVSWFRMLPTAETIYIPSWQEVVVTLNLISLGVVCFGLAARYLPLFEHTSPEVRREPRPWRGQTEPTARTCLTTNKTPGGNDHAAA